MVTQQEVYADIMREVEELGREHAKGKVVEYQKHLYAKGREGSRRFYAQDKDGIPKGAIPTVVNGKNIYCTLLTRNLIKRRAWQEPNGPDKPKHWNWCAWPPRTANDLTGCKSLCEFCAECDDPDTPDSGQLDHAYTAWITRAHDFWHNNICIRKFAKTGFGLYARNLTPKDTHIGEYTGLIVPFYGSEEEGMDSYKTDIDCGPRIPDDPLPQFACRHDATRKGSVFRFMNHSCNPNARLVQMRYGIHHRIVVVEATEDIEPGDPIIIFRTRPGLMIRIPVGVVKRSVKWERKRKRAEAEAEASRSGKKASKADRGGFKRDKVKKKLLQRKLHR